MIKEIYISGTVTKIAAKAFRGNNRYDGVLEFVIPARVDEGLYGDITYLNILDKVILEEGVESAAA